MRDGSLSDLYYALGEATLNTLLAKSMDEREFTHEEYNEDIEMFESLRTELIGEMFGNKL